MTTLREASQQTLEALENMNPLREESYLNYGTRLRSSIHGPCRVRHLYHDKLSAIIGNKPLGALADVWFRRDADGRIWEWHRDIEVEVIQDE